MERNRIWTIKYKHRFIILLYYSFINPILILSNEMRRGRLDIAAMSVVMKQAQVKQQAGLAVMKSAMTTAEANGAALIDMLNHSTVPQASHPHLGKQIDVKG